MSKPNEAWDTFKASLSQAACADLTANNANPLLPQTPTRDYADEDGETYDRFLGALTSSAQAAMRAQVREAEPSVEIAETAIRFGIVECPDGGWGQMRMFKNAEGLARRLQQLEGTDTIVWCFYGIPLPLTKGPQRYLSMPNGVQMIEVPMYEGKPVKLVNIDTLGNIEFEEQGFVGPPELAETGPMVTKSKSTKGEDDDDD